jgi:hypothetical protein
MRDDQMTAPTSRLRIFTADLIFETSGDALGALAEFREMDFEGEINDVTLDEDGWPSTACVDMYCWSRERLVDLYERVDAIATRFNGAVVEAGYPEERIGMFAESNPSHLEFRERIGDRENGGIPHGDQDD